MDRFIDFILNFYGPTPYFIIFGVLFACGLGLPIPEDITLFVAGVAAYYGVVNLWGMIAVAYIGVMLGDSIMFFLGKRYGRKLTRKGFFHRLLPDDRLNSVGKRLHEKGNSLIFVARFMPGLRAPIFFSAGTLHLPFRIFFFYDGAAALISVPLIIGSIYYFGDELDKVVQTIQRLEHGLVFVIISIIALFGLKYWIQHRKGGSKA